MTATLIDGKLLAGHIRDNLRRRITEYTNLKLEPPGLSVICVGDNPASQVYVKNKAKACKEIGMKSKIYNLPHSVSTYEVTTLLQELASDTYVNGIIVQLPLPDHIDQHNVIDHIPPSKDVDGFHPYNIGRLASRNPKLRPCTPYGIIKLLDSVGEVYKGRHAVVIGASNIVGRPMALELMLAGATVTVCHKFTGLSKLREFTNQADIVVSAVGRPEFIGRSFIKEGATVIDVGITRVDGKLKGDVKESVREKAAYVTPVPGGVGPMTVAMLLSNTLQTY